MKTLAGKVGEYEQLQDIKRRRQRPGQPVYADHTLQADIDALIVMIEGEPTDLELGADVDEVMDRFIKANEGLFDGVDTQEYLDSVRERDTGCEDDNDDLGIALRRLGREGLNKVLRETLGTPNPLYVDDQGNG